MTGILLLLLTGAVRQENEMQGLRLTAMAVFPVALALLTVFLLHPKNNYVNRSETLREELLEAAEDFPRFLETSAQRLASELRGGTTQQIDLGQVGPRASSSYPVMEVTSQTGGTIYLRGQDFDSYSGTGWNASRHRTEEFFLPGEIADTISIRTRSRRSLYYIPYYPGDTLTLTEGKNREIRRVMKSIGLEVSRLIRLSYGPFQLGSLKKGEAKEVPTKVLREQLGNKFEI